MLPVSIGGIKRNTRSKRIDSAFFVDCFRGPCYAYHVKAVRLCGLKLCNIVGHIQ